MDTLIIILQIAVSIALIALILLQERGGGVSGVFGGGGGGFYQTRRGVEKIVFVSTIVLTIAFIILAFISLFIS